MRELGRFGNNDSAFMAQSVEAATAVASLRVTTRAGQKVELGQVDCRLGTIKLLLMMVVHKVAEPPRLERP